jgi:hypothetical protein
MRPIDYFLVPGRAVLNGAFYVLQISPAAEYALLLTIAAGVLSYLIWLVGLKTLWFITLRLLGFA